MMTHGLLLELMINIVCSKDRVGSSEWNGVIMSKFSGVRMITKIMLAYMLYSLILHCLKKLPLHHGLHRSC